MAEVRERAAAGGSRAGRDFDPEGVRVIAAALRAWRIEAGLAQDDVADLLGVRRSAVARWERTERTAPAPGWALRRIAVAYGVPAARLLGLEG